MLHTCTQPHIPSILCTALNRTPPVPLSLCAAHPLHHTPSASHVRTTLCTTPTQPPSVPLNHPVLSGPVLPSLNHPVLPSRASPVLPAAQRSPLTLCFPPTQSPCAPLARFPLNLPPPTHSRRYLLAEKLPLGRCNSLCRHNSRQVHNSLSRCNCTDRYTTARAGATAWVGATATGQIYPHAGQAQHPGLLARCIWVALEVRPRSQPHAPRIIEVHCARRSCPIPERIQ